MSQLRRLANVDQHVTVSELKAGIHDILREKGYDMSSLYQEMEMDSLFIDTHDDRSTTADTVQLHSHLFYEILYCRSSGLEYLLGTRRYQVQKGDVIYIPPAISHRPLFLDKLPEPYSRYVIWISADYAAGLKENFPDAELLPDEPFLLRTMGTDWEDLGFLFRNGVQESLAGSAGWQAAVCGNTQQLLVHMMRARSGGTALRPPAEKRELLDELLLYIEKNLADRINLTDTARMFLVSESTINQLFRKRMKVSFYRFVTQRRLIAAKTLLMEGIPAETASAQVGFGDYSVFYRAFKREYGISPMEYRKLLK